MATTFFFKADGAVLMRVRISKRIEGVHREIMSSKRILTGLFISQKDWDDYHNLQSVNARDKYLERHPKFAGSIGKLQELRKRIDACGTDMNPQKMDDIITAVMNAEQIEREKQRLKEQEEDRLAKEAADMLKKKMTLSKFIDRYIKEIKEEKRTTLQHGRTYSKGSKFNTANALGHFKDFMKDTGVYYDFKDVDLECYNKYKTWLMAQDISKIKFKNSERNYKKAHPVPEGQKRYYSDNTIARFIKQLKAVLRAAESRGYPVNPAYKSAEFKGKVEDIDSIYLTRAELEKMEKVDFTKTADKKNYELARDIFMIGVWLAQRVSDYNYLRPENIKVEDDNGTQITYISIHQQKTGRLVEIPCNAKVCAILKKYPNGLPHLSEQKINRYIKDIGQMAEINDKIEVKESRGGKVEIKYFKKYELIGTHTARRTGATLMYLAGIPIYDIMRVTGHKSVNTLEKYIRADKLEVAQKLRHSYEYFK